MNLRLDHDQVALMISTGFSAALVAERLDCSARQVRRIAVSRGLTVEPDPTIGTDDEPALRRFYARSEGATRAARRFGVSRQTIYNDLREADGTSMSRSFPEAVSAAL
jgi:DNA invertase Pin-like site-specific DNA recombinase